jgi:hypothetical protein
MNTIRPVFQVLVEAHMRTYHDKAGNIFKSVYSLRLVRCAWKLNIFLQNQYIYIHTCVSFRKNVWVFTMVWMNWKNLVIYGYIYCVF